MRAPEKAPTSKAHAPLRQFELVEKIRAYDAHADEDLLNRAYIFAMRAHGDQSRLSGDPYFSHPVEVAGILADLRVDPATIATALLHDTIEDTSVTRDDIAAEFGEEIAELVDGVTKLARIELRSEQSKQAENFRKLVIAVAKDVRVLLVKLADRLHNMRTLNYMPDPEKRRRIAIETMEIYAPLAGRIGVQRIREELEDLAFMEINPAARASIEKRLEYLRPRAKRAVKEIAQRISDQLESQGLRAKVVTREKRPFSIWRKMEEKNVEFEQVADIFGIRIIVDTPEDCYRALGVIHSEWRYIPGRFKDYISTPKPNNYRSIHTAVWGPDMQQVELQIRTRDMDETAERGVAAHWRYKDPALRDREAKSVEVVSAAGPKGHDPYNWLQNVVQMLEHGDDVEEFLEHTKLELFRDQVFCFTPKGKLIELPRGATPVDFAYAVHTDVGDTCVGAKINGRSAPLRTPLRNGDMVEILRSDKAQPPQNWESLAITGRARSGIRRLIRRSEKDEYMKLGAEILAAAAAAEDVKVTDKGLGEALKRLNLVSVDYVYEKLGRGDLAAQDVLDAILPGRPKQKASSAVKPSTKPAVGPEGVVVGGGAAVPISGLQPGVVVHMAACCSPLPGDRIVGVRTPGKGVVIHTIDCETLAQEDPPQTRWIDLKWRDTASQEVNAVGRIILTVQNAPGVLGEISNVIADYGGNISNVRITNREIHFFEIQVDVEVSDVRHLTNIVAALRASASIIRVDRIRG
ncbi:MAG: bifunctional (p)ppGpp synthetase/guanosine-3',5'-bis(diphosphate) 3'-pyrophosphohydrolase [Parvularculaceae bacterium]